MSRLITSLFLLSVGLCSTAVAGPLATDPNAYNFIWHGSEPYSSGDLAGYVDWAIYDVAHMPAGFAGYDRPEGFFLYTYQVYETGPGTLTSFSLNLQAAYAEGIGTFTATGVDGDPALSMRVDYDSDSNNPFAVWTFAGVSQGHSTTGLLLSSPYYVGEHFTAGTIVGGDAAALSIPIGGPSDGLPEPSSLVLAAIGFVGLAAWRWRRDR